MNLIFKKVIRLNFVSDFFFIYANFIESLFVHLVDGAQTIPLKYTGYFVSLLAVPLNSFPFHTHINGFIRCSE
jgi:hypothetical protein